MPIQIPTAIEEEDEDNLGFLGTTDFAVTRDFGIQKIHPVAVDNQGPHSPKARRKLEMQENIENRVHYTDSSNIHDLSV